MDNLVTFQCLFYSFLYGFVMTGLYHVVNRFLMKVPRIIRYLLQVIIGCLWGILYFYGLVLLNDGILRLYFFVFIFMGYMFYSRYYAYFLLYFLEKIVYVIKRILAPFFFFFHSINVIIQKRIKKVRLKWRKKQDLNGKDC